MCSCAGRCSAVSVSVTSTCSCEPSRKSAMARGAEYEAENSRQTWRDSQMTSESGEGSASAEVREQIVKAARNCFVRYGTAKTSMADVARDAGVSRGTVYRYFADRAALAEAVFAYESHMFHEGM